MFYINGSSTDIYFYAGSTSDFVSTTINNNSWYHIAGTYDGNFAYLYINGEEVGNMAISTPLEKNNYNLFIGDDGESYSNFVGQLDETRIWDRVLTQEEIKANMTKEISAQANLLLYFDYNQGVPKGDNTSISTIWDKSGNDFNGKLNAFSLADGDSTSNFVNSEIVLISELPQDNSSCDYVAQNFKITAKGSPSLAYQWLFSDDSGLTFNNLIESAEFVGVQNDTLIVDFSAINENYLFFCEILDVDFVTYSDTVKNIKKVIPSMPNVSVVNNCGNSELTTDATEYITWSNGSHNVTITVTDANLYSVVQELDGCVSALGVGTSAPKEVPATPTITFDGSVLHSDATTGNQWYKNGVLIVDAINQDFTPIEDDVYTVIVTNVDACASEVSNTIIVITTGIENNLNSDISVFPNPTTGKVNIKFENLNSNTKISFLDLTGKSIIEKEISAKTTISEFDLSKFPKGVYLVKVLNNDNVKIEKIVVE